MLIIENFINGKFITSQSQLEHINSFEPATGSVWALIPNSDEQDVKAAYIAAEKAFPRWSETSARVRATYMNRIADLLESRLDEFASIESKDQGKPVSLAASVDIPRAVYNFRFFASGILHHLESSSFQTEYNARNFTQRSPVGVVGLISPWNLPLYLLSFKLAPAIACGNTVIAKPSEMTSVTAWMLCRIFQEAGLPEGVINIVHGYGHTVGEAIVAHPQISAVSFTGSVLTAEKIRMASAKFSKKLSLELGGKNAAIIFKDADLEKCLSTTIRSCFSNQGEICLCTSRIFVQCEIYNQFLERFVELARNYKVGDPNEKDTQMGALISQEHLNKVRGFVQLALQEGATVQCGYGVDELVLPERCEKGYFIRPTVVSNVSDTSNIMQEEIFGPVVCVVPFSEEEEVIQRANNVKYGLCGVVWSTDVNRVNRVAQKLQVGTCWCNCWLVRDLNMPFGGMKASGVGREGNHDSLDFYTEVKNICIQIS